jgi:hypothetical protein
MAQDAELRAALERCDQEQRRIKADGSSGPLWLLALGWADWEAEKELIRREHISKQANSN